MVPLSKVPDLSAKHSKLEKELSNRQLIKNLSEKSKEYSDLNEMLMRQILI